MLGQYTAFLTCACILSIPWCAPCRSARVWSNNFGRMQTLIPLRRRPDSTDSSSQTPQKCLVILGTCCPCLGQPLMLCKVVQGQVSFMLYHIFVYIMYIFIFFILYRLGELYILYIHSIYFLSFFLLLYVAQYILYYLTQLLLIFRFLNPQNSMLYDSHNYE